MNKKIGFGALILIGATFASAAQAAWVSDCDAMGRFPGR
jgi:hypothetical protein